MSRYNNTDGLQQKEQATSDSSVQSISREETHMEHHPSRALAGTSSYPFDLCLEEDMSVLKSSHGEPCTRPNMSDLLLFN